MHNHTPRQVVRLSTMVQEVIEQIPIALNALTMYVDTEKRDKKRLIADILEFKSVVENFKGKL